MLSARTHLLILPFLTLFLFSCHSDNVVSSSEDTVKNGALQALQLYGSQRQYPYDSLPAQSFYHAWQDVQTQFRSDKSARLRSPNSYEWEALGPWNTSGRMLSLAIHPRRPSTIWAGSASGGVWRTDEFGIDTSWYKVETGYPVNGVGAVAVSPIQDSVIFIGTGEVYNYERSGDGAAYRSTRGTPGIGILKSEDLGKSWSVSLDWTRDQNKGVHHIQVDPNFAGRVYAATTEGVYFSPDTGKTWIHQLKVPMCTDIGIDPFDSDKVVAICGNFDTPGKGIYYTEDGGESWDLGIGDIPDFHGKGRLDHALSKSGVVYASIGDGFSTQMPTATWTLRSNDHGKTWEEISTVDYSRWQGWFAHDIAAHPRASDTIIGIGIYIHKSEESGRMFEQITRNPQVTSGRPPVEGPDGPEWYTHVDHHAVIYHPVDRDTVLVANDGGVFISRDGGENWESRNGGLQTTQFYNGISIIQEEKEFALGGLQDNNSVVYDGDKAWTRILAGDGSYTAVDPINNQIRFGSAQNLYLYRSLNGGRNWNRIDVRQGGDSPCFIAPFVIHPVQSQVLYAGSNYVYISEDSGENWIRTNEGRPLNGSDPVYSLAVAPSDATCVYAGTAPFDNPSSLWVTRNAGDDWSQIGLGQLPDRYPVDIAVHPEDPGKAVVVFSGYGTGHVFLTYDYGDNWEDITGNLPDIPTNAVAFAGKGGEQLYIGNDISVYYTLDEGQSWAEMQNGLPEAVVVSDLKVSDTLGLIYVATHGNGMYRSDLVDPNTTITNAIDDHSILVSPNPLHRGDILTISRLDTSEGIAELVCISIDGRIVKSANVNFDGTSIQVRAPNQSGLYTLRIIDANNRVFQQSITVN